MQICAQQRTQQIATNMKSQGKLERHLTTSMAYQTTTSIEPILPIKVGRRRQTPSLRAISYWTTGQSLALLLRQAPMRLIAAQSP